MSPESLILLKYEHAVHLLGCSLPSSCMVGMVEHVRSVHGGDALHPPSCCSTLLLVFTALVLFLVLVPLF